MKRWKWDSGNLDGQTNWYNGLRKEIEQSIRSGIDKDALFNKYRDGTNDVWIRRLLARYADPQVAEASRAIIWSAIVITAVTWAASMILTGRQIVGVGITIWQFAFHASWQTAIMWFLIRWMWKRDVYGFAFLFLASCVRIAGLFEQTQGAVEWTPQSIGVASAMTILFVAAAVVAHLTRTRVFPYHGLVQPKKDESGNFRFK